MTLTDFLAQYRALAEKATKGPWRAFMRNHTVSISLPDKYGKTPCVVNWPGFDGCDLPLKEQKANARHIAAFYPERALAMLRVIECYEEALAANRHWALVGDHTPGSAASKRLIKAELALTDAKRALLGEEE